MRMQLPAIQSPIKKQRDLPFDMVPTQQKEMPEGFKNLSENELVAQATLLNPRFCKYYKCRSSSKDTEKQNCSDKSSKWPHHRPTPLKKGLDNKTSFKLSDIVRLTLLTSIS